MITRDIWNPWHGCMKVSEGCDHCYMYFLDRMRGQDGSRIRRSKTGFDLPLKKDRHGDYKIHSGEKIRVCMNSDFFLKEADPWRQQAWDIMRRRSDASCAAAVRSATVAVVADGVGDDGAKAPFFVRGELSGLRC